MTYFILSLDGGGIRGVLTARLLERLEQAQPFLHKVDLVAGTSTGGILALGLANGMSPAELRQLYVDHGRDIFKGRDALDLLAGRADELWRSGYANKGLESVLRRVFGELELGNLTKRVLIPSFDLDNEARRPEPRFWKPKFFHNYEGPGSDSAVKVVDAALRTSAAPTYFPTYQGFVDGGVVANNPSVCAVAKAIKAGALLEDIRVLSVGTGFNPHRVQGQALDWGKAQWITELIPMLFDGMPGVANYQCEQLLGANYLRLDVALDEIVGLDEVAKIDTLLAIGDRQSIDSAVDFLGRAQGGAGFGG